MSKGRLQYASRDAKWAHLFFGHHNLQLKKQPKLATHRQTCTYNSTGAVFETLNNLQIIVNVHK